jgi:hypothetical protein
VQDKTPRHDKTTSYEMKQQGEVKQQGKRQNIKVQCSNKVKQQSE